jgi:2-C-methyl-D-erythritol 2,4-cyclodiphosphate synthase
LPIRIGHGYDIHRLGPGKKLIIGGVDIPFDKGAEAHSDGDVIYHSVVDAILGALGLPDIGQLFPDNDPQWSGSDSSIFMEEVRTLTSSHFSCIAVLYVRTSCHALMTMPISNCTVPHVTMCAI